MSLHRRAPRPLSTALTALQAEVAPRTVIAEVQRIWASVVGELIATEAKPVSERAGVLTVSCRAAVWAAELDADSELILTRLNEHLAGGVVIRLRCVIGSE